METVGRRCLWCGHEFHNRNRNVKYCSEECRRKMKRKRNRRYKDTCHCHPEGSQVILEFDCRKCGKHVAVTDSRDKRTVLCCVSCERQYWKHAYRYRNRGCEPNQGMSGGMDIVRLKKRERMLLE